MRKINKISNITLIFMLMLMEIFISQGFAYPYNTSKLRSPLNTINNERADEARGVLVQKHEERVLVDSEKVKNRPIGPLIKQSFPDAHNISFADLDTGTGEFVTNFTAYLKRRYENVESIGVES